MATPAKYHLACPALCSFRPGTPNSEWVSDLLATEGVSLRDIIAVGAKRDPVVVLYTGTLSRHSKHLRKEEEVVAEDGERAKDLDVLDAIIQAGWRNRAKWRPTITDTMKAMDMRLKMTQGSVFQDLLDVLAAGASDDVEDEDEVPESALAVASVDEQAQAGTDDE